jgi:diguanylate cyclase (GGDEF)-like protein/PAS domain S-box-containing protein
MAARALGSPTGKGIRRLLSTPREPESDVGGTGHGSLLEVADSWQKLIELAPEAVMIVCDGVVVYANEAAADQVGAAHRRELIGLEFPSLLAPEDRAQATARCIELLADGGRLKPAPFKRLRLDGTVLDVEAVAVGIVWRGRPAILGMSRDISERKRTEAALEETLARHRQLIEHAPDAIVGHCRGRIVVANQMAVKLLAAKRADELIGLAIDAIGDARGGGLGGTTWQRAAADDSIGATWTGRLRRLDGRYISADWTSIPFHHDGEPAIYSVIRDIGPRLEAEAINRYLASHDILTKLPNRFSFMDQLKAALAHARRKRRRLAVLFLDVDNFKVVNDSLGHQTGDRLLELVARRLRDAIRPTDCVARLGGDEFALIQNDVEVTQDIAALAAKLIQVVATPCDVSRNRLYPTATIGIAIYPDDGKSPDELLREADMALYKAKADGRNTYGFFTEDLSDKVRQRERLLSDIGGAVSRREFLLHYQPIVGLQDGRVRGVEALLRWQHPERGLLSAGVFVDTLESSPQAAAVGEQVLRTACRQAKAWQDQGLPPMRIAVNLSMNQMQQPDLVGSVVEILMETGLDPRFRELELTETVILGAGANRVAETLRDLRALGIQIALDDFGTGYSSLTFLKRFPVGRIKIDRSFVAGFGSNREDTEIVRAVIRLGEGLNLDVTAEGVEGAEAIDFLRAEGCAEMQGYYLAFPMACDDLITFLRNRNREEPAPELAL